MGLISSPDFIERSEQMRAFTKGIWVAIHFKFIRYAFIAMPRWIMGLLSDEFVKMHIVSIFTTYDSPEIMTVS